MNHDLMLFETRIDPVPLHTYILLCVYIILSLTLILNNVDF